MSDDQKLGFGGTTVIAAGAGAGAFGALKAGEIGRAKKDAVLTGPAFEAVEDSRLKLGDTARAIARMAREGGTHEDVEAYVKTTHGELPSVLEEGKRYLDKTRSMIEKGEGEQVAREGEQFVGRAAALLESEHASKALSFAERVAVRAAENPKTAIVGGAALAAGFASRLVGTTSYTAQAKRDADAVRSR